MRQKYDFASTMKTYRARHPERVKAHRRAWYVARRLKAMRMVGEARCRRCGCDEFDFLEFNHIGGNGCKEWKKIRSEKLMPIHEQILLGKRDVDGLEILCRVCNALDFLERKNSSSAKHFLILWTGGGRRKNVIIKRWEALTGKSAKKISS